MRHFCFILDLLISYFGLADVADLADDGSDRFLRDGAKHDVLSL